MTEMLDNSLLPWDQLLEFLSPLESCHSPDQFYAAVAGGLALLMPFDLAAVFCRGFHRLLYAEGGTQSRLRYASTRFLSAMPFLEDPRGRPVVLRPAENTPARTSTRVPHVIRMAVGGGPPGSDRLVALHRFGRGRQFTPREKRILEVLSPHVCNLAALIHGLPLRSYPEPTRDELARAARALTGREVQVAVLLCKGCTTSEIATRLFISERTVESHVAHICGKLEVSRRRQAVTVIRERLRVRRAGRP